MNIDIISVGKLKEDYLKSGINEFLKRMNTYAKISITEIPDEKAPENMSDAELERVKSIEGQKILAKLKESSYVIALAIEGKQLSSEAFAAQIDKLMTDGYGDITFIIGGSNGLSDEVLSRAQYLLSFSKMTFPHQLMRLILMEQIYRAFRIMNNHPYHK